MEMSPLTWPDLSKSNGPHLHYLLWYFSPKIRPHFTSQPLPSLTIAAKRNTPPIANRSELNGLTYTDQRYPITTTQSLPSAHKDNLLPTIKQRIPPCLIIQALRAPTRHLPPSLMLIPTSPVSTYEEKKRQARRYLPRPAVSVPSFVLFTVMTSPSRNLHHLLSKTLPPSSSPNPLAR